MFAIFSVCLECLFAFSYYVYTLENIIRCTCTHGVFPIADILLLYFFFLSLKSGTRDIVIHF